MRLALLASLTISPSLAGLIGVHSYGELDVNGASVTLLIGGLLAVSVGILSFRTMNDRPGVPLRADVTARSGDRNRRPRRPSRST